jgi:hypothetical protein
VIEEDLRYTYSGLNPKFFIGKKVLDKRLIQGTKTSNNRVQMVKQMGESNRVRMMNEEMGILGYMRRNKMDKQSDKVVPELNPKV